MTTSTFGFALMTIASVGACFGQYPADPTGPPSLGPVRIVAEEPGVVPAGSSLVVQTDECGDRRSGHAGYDLLRKCRRRCCGSKRNGPDTQRFSCRTRRTAAAVPWPRWCRDDRTDPRTSGCDGQRRALSRCNRIRSPGRRWPRARTQWSQVGGRPCGTRRGSHERLPY
jgi:hypothetical protein